MTSEAKKILAHFTHSTLKTNLIELGAVKQCDVLNGDLVIELVMPFVWNEVFEELQSTLTPNLLNISGVNDVKWNMTYDIANLKRANNQPAIRNIKNIIAVSSGKGGVGKSSTAVNIALALQKEGAKVGILDADIYGPSIPTMLGTQNEQPRTPDNKHMTPIMAYGLASSSIGYLTDQSDAMVWRGPMASKALLQMIQDTLWPELDYLVVDMPPGTGDIQLTLAQSIPVTAAVIVTTPQDIALIDAKKGITMFNKVNVPTVGIVENMSYHICAKCGHKENIFGEEGAAQLAKHFNTQLLGQIPLHRLLRLDLDNGSPTVALQPDSEFSKIYRKIALTISSELYWQGEVCLPDIAFKAL